MSSPLAHLPSRPERARVKHSENIALEATGFQPALQSGLKKPKKRTRRRAMHEVSLKSSLPMPSKLSEDPIFTYFQEETEKKDGASCVFLLWGSENSESFTTWAVDVPITDVESEQDIFDSLAKRYHKELGLLRRCFSFRKFNRLRPATFRFICRSSKKFLVFVEPLDLDDWRKSYSEQQEEATKLIESIEDFDSTDFPDHCYRDNSGEYNHCNSDCPTNSSKLSGVSTCPFQEWDRCNDQIRWIKTASFLSCYFHNPLGASSQKILNGLSNHHFIHHYRNICLPAVEFRPQNRYLELHGLYVETAWCPRKCLCVFLGILLSVVIGGKVFWGSWEIIFGAGSFIVALLMLVLTVLNLYDV
ncbi:hypothetical protein C7974DRAFT_374445 [Boeremia exigua]|uniref:uncharacterized protein n=1 Tax=Boeremia exigua TaxID=749465 RepID=UPI001E8CEE81|nr:uncharacterized protein C7974DRAFT_374445 [Boeremia exigua]KAH6637809.1 hypothetical protein C7974DRAFT_374445 [Boeremia exigua]